MLRTCHRSANLRPTLIREHALLVVLFYCCRLRHSVQMPKSGRGAQNPLTSLRSSPVSVELSVWRSDPYPSFCSGYPSEHWLGMKFNFRDFSPFSCSNRRHAGRPLKYTSERSNTWTFLKETCAWYHFGVSCIEVLIVF